MNKHSDHEEAKALYAIAVQAWMTNKAPTKPAEHEAILDIENGDIFLCIYVSWHSGLRAYQAEPMHEINEAAYQEVELFLEDSEFYLLKKDLGDLGVRHMTRVYRQAEPRSVMTDKLSELIMPTTITVPRRYRR